MGTFKSSDNIKPNIYYLNNNGAFTEYEKISDNSNNYSPILFEVPTNNIPLNGILLIWMDDQKAMYNYEIDLQLQTFTITDNVDLKLQNFEVNKRPNNIPVLLPSFVNVSEFNTTYDIVDEVVMIDGNAVTISNEQENITETVINKLVLKIKFENVSQTVAGRIQLIGE